MIEPTIISPTKVSKHDKISILTIGVIVCSFSFKPWQFKTILVQWKYEMTWEKYNFVSMQWHGTVQCVKQYLLQWELQQGWHLLEEHSGQKDHHCWCMTAGVVDEGVQVNIGMLCSKREDAQAVVGDLLYQELPAQPTVQITNYSILFLPHIHFSKYIWSKYRKASLSTREHCVHMSVPH